MTAASRAIRDTLGTFVERAAQLPPDQTFEDLFSITGQVLITSFFGLITVAMPAEAITMALALDPDSAGSDTAIATASASMSGYAAGTWLLLNTTAGGALSAATDVGYHVRLNYQLAAVAGDIKLTTAGGGAIGTTARVKWGLTYLPLSQDGAVVAV
jgi:hypothetical protein